MVEIQASKTFRKWLADLSDLRAQFIISARINRLAKGLPGDIVSIGEGLFELRIHYGPGYRIYFKRYGATIVLLLCGGKKGSQTRDIALAKAIARAWRN